MVIKLRSPGPFSGTAAFDLLEVSKTAFLKFGNPVVGNEEVEGKSFFTQTHQFSVYSQQEGKVVIPSFLVRFSGKKDFTSEAEAMEGKTPELTFQSKRPEGTEGIGVVVTVTGMKVSQTWSSSEGREVDAGDVLRRTVTRSAADTTAMIFPPIDNGAPDGVKVYGEDPVVEDKTERGVISAKREETLRYQFVRAGTYTLPDLTISWWDPKTGKLEQEVLPGETVTVRMSEAAVAGVKEERKIWPWLLGVVTLVVALWFRRQQLSEWYHDWQKWRHRPEVVTSKDLLEACRKDEAKAAYLAAMSW
ncbi:MAG: hypothetical protein ACON5N_18095 [Akkermansiaceae bacterium]